MKSLTRGYGSLEYDFTGYREAKVKKLVIHLMDDPIDALSFMVHEDRAFEIGKRICLKLKDNLP